MTDTSAVFRAACGEDINTRAPANNSAMARVVNSSANAWTRGIRGYPTCKQYVALLEHKTQFLSIKAARLSKAMIKIHMRIAVTDCALHLIFDFGSVSTARL